MHCKYCDKRLQLKELWQEHLIPQGIDYVKADSYENGYQCDSCDETFHEYELSIPDFEREE